MNLGTPVRITRGPYWLQIGALGFITSANDRWLVVTLLHRDGDRRRLYLLPGEVEAR